VRKTILFLADAANFVVEIGYIRRKIQQNQAENGRVYRQKPLSQEVY
jgi:hypothetical protein